MATHIIEEKISVTDGRAQKRDKIVASLPHIERSQIRYSGLMIRMLMKRIPQKLHQAKLAGRGPRGRSTNWIISIVLINQSKKSS